MGAEKRTKKAPAEYRERTYRDLVAGNDLVSTYVVVRETDLHILASVAVAEPAEAAVYRYRNQLENYIAAHPGFLEALVPLPADPLAPPIIREMLKAGIAANVGPMAAVAGAVAEYVGRDLLAAGVAEIIVENGGDIFISRARESVISIFAGESPFSGQLGVQLAPASMPLGICTSSGTVGHSLSLGQADSVTVIAKSTSLADAVATRLANEITEERDMDRALAIARTMPGIMGVVMVKDGQLGAWGEVTLVEV